MSIRFLATHGKRHGGYNPRHTDEGIEQIRALNVPPRVSVIIYGTGLRFLEMRDVFSERKPEIPCLPSPFCGGPEGGDMIDGEFLITLADGSTVRPEEYLGITHEKLPFDTWEFMMRFIPERALLCSGGELLTALGRPKYEKGRIYSVNVGSRQIRDMTDEIPPTR